MINIVGATIDGPCPDCGERNHAPATCEEAKQSQHDAIKTLLEPAIAKMRAETEPAEPPRKVSYIGAPACFALEMACQLLNRAFGGFGCYQVGSSLLRADWRDVDVRLIMPDVEFLALFPDVDLESYNWEFDPRWLIMTTSISDHLRKVTGLPVDFQFQPHGPSQRHAEKKRSPLGLRFARQSRPLGMAVDP